jgi:hypothetical protein
MTLRTNFSHIVNYDTIVGVKVVSALSGYGKDDIVVCTPEFFVRGDEDEKDR